MVALTNFEYINCLKIQHRVTARFITNSNKPLRSHKITLKLSTKLFSIIPVTNCLLTVKNRKKGL